MVRTFGSIGLTILGGLRRRIRNQGAVCLNIGTMIVSVDVQLDTRVEVADLRQSLIEALRCGMHQRVRSLLTFSPFGLKGPLELRPLPIKEPRCC